MKTEKSKLMVYAAVAAIVGVTGNFISASVLLQKSNLWIVFSAVGVGASLLAAYITLVASRRQSAEASISKGQVFLSYAREDKEQAEKIYKELQTEGFEPWMDVEELLPGENWMPAIEQAVENSDFFVALISKDSIDKRGFIQREVKFALDLLNKEPSTNTRIIVALLENVAVPEALANFHNVNLFDTNSFSNLIRELKGTSENAK